MTLTVEDGTGKTDADSYISVADADTYHTNHSASTDWSAATEANKEKAIRLATQYVDARYSGLFRGYKNTAAQALAWPRTDAVNNEGYVIDSDVLPQCLPDAVSELALRVIEGDTLFEDISKPGLISSKSVTVGPISKSTSYVAGMSETKKYPLIEALMSTIVILGQKLERG